MRKISYLAVCSVVLISLVMSPLVAYAWGDSDGGRDTYSLQQINEGVLGDKITFNSISAKDSDYDWYRQTYGEELPDTLLTEEVNYVGARMRDDTSGLWHGNDITAEDGQTYIIRLYVHNNNPGGMDAVATDTRVAFNIPLDSANSIQVNGYITSANASPAEYVDYVNFHADQPFHLEYISGSAFLENNGIAADGGVALSDDIVKSESGGVQIGYDTLDGNIPGGYEYAAYIGIEVRVVYDYSYTADVQVRLADSDGEWQQQIDAKVGDVVEYQIAYTNTDSITHDGVVVRSVLPDNVEYIAGSTVLYDANHPDGITINADELVGENGITIGNYTAGSNAYVRFKGEVVNKNLVGGSNTLVNWGRVTVGSQVQQTHADVIVQNNGLLQIITIILLIVAILSGIAFIILRLKIRREKYRNF